MDYFEWNSSMETGIEIIDAQHREITRHVNTVYHAVCLKERALEEASMRELFACIEEHLQFEEELLDAAGYPGLNAHRRSHGKFRQRLHRYFATFIDGNDVSLALLADLRMWLTTHIRYDDTAYASHLLQQLAPGVPMQQKNRFTPVSSLFARRAPPIAQPDQSGARHNKTPPPGWRCNIALQFLHHAIKHFAPQTTFN